jgi:predicted phosphate transport protein (TIGR00153 family)
MWPDAPAPPERKRSMKFRLLPEDVRFFDLFQQAAANTAQCARRLGDVLAAPGDHEAVEKVRACEKAGDEITQSILDRLNTSFVTPFDREDIHALAEEFDDVVDDMLAVARRIELLQLTTVLPELVLQGGLLVKLADEAAELMARLESMKDMGPHLAAIDELESEGDEIFNQVLARLLGGEFEPLEVLRWKDLVEAMEASMNALEDISDVVEGIVLKHS